MLFCLKFSFKLVTFSKSYTKKTKVGIFSEYSVQMPRVRDQRRKWGIERAKFVRLLDVWVHPVRATSEKRLWLYSPLRWRKSLHARRSGKNGLALFGYFVAILGVHKCCHSAPTDFLVSFFRSKTIWIKPRPQAILAWDRGMNGFWPVNGYE